MAIVPWSDRARALADPGGLLEVRFEHPVFGFAWDPPVAGANRSALHRLFFVLRNTGSGSWLAAPQRQPLTTGSAWLAPAGSALAFRFAPGLDMFACDFAFPDPSVTEPFALGLQHAPLLPEVRRRLPAILRGADAAAACRLHGLCRLQIAEWLRPDLLAEARRLHDRFAALAPVFAAVDARTRVRDCARRLGLSDNACSQAYRRATGHALQSALHRRLAERCCRRLVADRSPLRAIAEEFGFRDQFHFSRFVKRHTGLSPSAYRERYRNPG